MDNWGPGTCTLSVSRLYRRAIGVPDDLGLPMDLTARSFRIPSRPDRELSTEILFESVQGDVGQQRGYDSTLRCAGLRCDKPLVIEDPSLEPAFDQSVQGRGCLQLTQEGGLVDAVATLGDISVQGVLGLLLNRDEDRTDGIVDRASGAESVAVGLKLGLPLRLQGVFDQGLPCPIMKRGNRE